MAPREVDWLLRDLDRQLSEMQAPVVGLLRPGLSDTAIDALCSSHAFDLPDELRAWWRWHNGTDVARAQGRGNAGRDALLTLHRGFQPSLEEALRKRDRLLGEAADPFFKDSQARESYWHPRHLPLTVGNNHTWLAAPNSGGGVQIRRMDFEGAHAEVVASSLAALLVSWLAALRSGAVWFVPEFGWDVAPGVPVEEERELRRVL